MVNVLRMRLVARLMRGWVRLYTGGLPPKFRDERRAEIDSDLWEQERDAHVTGRRPEVTATGMVGRWFIGIPADLSWRIDLTLTSSPGGHERGLMNGPKGQTAFMGIAGLMAAITVILFVSVWLGMFESHVSGHDVPRFVWGIVGVSAAAMIFVGLSAGRRLPMLGHVIVIVGAFPLAAILVWTILLPGLWLLLVMLLLVKVQRFAWT